MRVELGLDLQRNFGAFPDRPKTWVMRHFADFKRNFPKSCHHPNPKSDAAQHPRARTDNPLQMNLTLKRPSTPTKRRPT